MSDSGQQPEYGEGDWFAVPLRSSGYGIGVIARMHQLLFGYFFGPRRDRLPKVQECAELKPDSAVLTRRFADLGLQDGSWSLLGRTHDWDRSAWPILPMIRHDELAGRNYRMTYADDDSDKLLHQEALQPDDPAEGPTDGLMGSGFVELKLTRLLG